MKKAVTVSIVLGTGWVFGFMVLATDRWTGLNEVIRWLFILCNTTQVISIVNIAQVTRRLIE